MTNKSSYAKRYGALGLKIGMIRMPIGDKMLAVTALDLSDCTIVSHITEDKRKYNAVQVGIGTSKSVNKPQKEMFKKLGMKKAFQYLKEFRVNSLEDAMPVGTPITAAFFKADANGDKYVDITSESKGKGFAGGMKRWNFKGLRATHGVSASHRSGGSTGHRTSPGRVFPGKKMPGHLGCDRVTMRTLRVVHIDEVNNVIFVNGSVPGNKGKCVMIRDAILG